MKAVFRPAARRDIVTHVGYLIDENRLEAAERFPIAVEQAVRRIVEQPAIGSPRSYSNQALTGLRSWPVPEFEDLRVYYVQPLPSVIRILRVLHGKRDLQQLFQSSPPTD